MADFPLGGANKSFSSGFGATSGGVAVVASTSANTKGVYAELDASTESDSSGMFVTLTPQTSSSNYDALFDVAVGGAGSEVVVLENYHFSTDAAGGGPIRSRYVHVPISIPSGTRLSARYQTTTTDADETDCVINLMVPSFESNPGYGGIVTYGANTGTSLGTPIDAGATLNTQGAWVEFSASSEAFTGFFLSVGGNGNSAAASANWLVNVGVGSAGNEEIIANGVPAKSSSFEDWHVTGQFYNIAIPSGSRIAMQMQGSNNNSVDRVLTFAFHGVK